MTVARKIMPLVLVLCLILSLSACGEQPDPEAELKSISYVDSMDTFMTLTAYGSNRANGLKAAEAEILRLNDLFSIGVSTSEVALANSTGSASLSPETLKVLNGALDVYNMTDGAFDITVTPLMELWGFTNGEHSVPSKADIDAVMSLTGIDKVAVDTDNSTLTLTGGAQIDLGGIAKGYTSQRVMEIFKENGIKSGIVSLGGNVQCLGCKPDGSKWRVAIREPWGFETSYIAVVEVEDCAVITSGGYERYFTDDTGKIYCHILDPKTGTPVESDLESVSIISKDGMLADGLSTSLYIMGLDKSCEFWRENSDKFDIILIDSQGTLYISSGIYNSVTTDKNTVKVER